MELLTERFPEKIEEYKEFLKEQKGKPGNLMAALHEAQYKFGYIPSEIQEIISNIIRVPLAEIYGVITFYSQFTLVPKGEIEVGVCMGTACYVKHAMDTLEAFENEVGVKAGNTASDGSISIEATRCLGACSLAPVVAINEKRYSHLHADDVKAALEDYKNGAKK